MKKLSKWFTLLLLLTYITGNAQTKEGENYSLSYEECIAAYQKLANSSKIATLSEWGKTDIGRPLHLFVINKSGKCSPEDFEKEKTVLLINNGIHPGEPCGIDASVRFANDLINDSKLNALLDHTIICIIPVYNVGGSMNRGCCSRANQNGPEKYGFRGNARNLDLNRDFVKRDSENARSFSKIFHAVNPHYFIDTHTSNGADYQYTMTMITTQPDKLSAPLRGYTKNTINPAIYESMKNRGWEMVPYVYMMGRTPKSGIKDFPESPRYSTGYAALFNTIGFTSETHMFKPFKDRVESTYQFEMTLLEYMAEHHKDILKLKKEADDFAKTQSEFVLEWQLDTNSFETIPFKGFDAEFKTSILTGEERLSYNREKPSEFDIRYYNTYIPKTSVQKPKEYIIPQAWKEVIERLQENGVVMTQLTEDITKSVEAYHIVDYKSPKNPYEGHYLHTGIKLVSTIEEINFMKGDYVIQVDQSNNRYIVETLEPTSPDSFFAWNFFDSALQQKEWFSDYIFEDNAIEILRENPELKTEYEAYVNENPTMDHWAQLYWLYTKSGYYENSFNRYPVYRVN